MQPRRAPEAWLRGVQSQQWTPGQSEDLCEAPGAGGTSGGDSAPSDDQTTRRVRFSKFFFGDRGGRLAGAWEAGPTAVASAAGAFQATGPPQTHLSESRNKNIYASGSSVMRGRIHDARSVPAENLGTRVETPQMGCARKGVHQLP